ncbi:hypothetical protein AB0L88_44530 [Saccharopolyspora shandongensis]|uniref:hypothetical protein n=1 Tax=Saccharopolyspora shandongensis TaxID=418495 RepID=UPI0034202485
MGAVQSAETAPGKQIGNDDYSLRRVPQDARYGFGSMLLQWQYWRAQLGSST